MTRRDLHLPNAIERALHGKRPTAAASDPLRAAEEWEVVVAAVHLALIGTLGEQPPAHLGPKLARLLASSTKRTP